jgi:hypothetical protein
MENKTKKSSSIERDVQKRSRVKSQPGPQKGKKNQEIFVIENQELNREVERRNFHNPPFPEIDPLEETLQPLGIGYSQKQKMALIEGYKKRLSLIRASSEVAIRALEYDSVSGDFKPDTILSGSTGIGKTYNTKRAFELEGIKPYEIGGNTSLFIFGINLMLKHYEFERNKKDDNERLVVLLDDCDSFFSDKNSINILKKMSDKRGSRVFEYNKAIQYHLIPENILPIIELYKFRDGSAGFSINCDDVIFVINTNFKFPSENFAKQFIDKHGPTNKANRYMDLAAIRRRFNIRDFILEKDVNWGWIAYVSLFDGLLDPLDNEKNSEFKKWRILNFMYDNWHRMTESNLDTVTSLMHRMIKNPKNFMDIWEAEFIEETSNS